MGNTPKNGDESYESHESHEGYESHEGDEGHEIHEEGHEEVHHRTWSYGQGYGLPWIQGEDQRWFEEGVPHQEQDRKDRLQEGVRCRQEEQVGHRFGQGPQGIEG